MRASHLGLLPLLLATSLSAQTVDEVVARYIAARGGAERLRTLESLRLVGTISPAPGQAGPFRLELKRPGKMRVEMTVQGMTLTQATDGQAAWVIAPMVGAGGAVLLPPEEAAGLKDQADMEGPLVNWAAKGNKVELRGQETRFGGEAFRLKVKLKSGDVRYLYIDRQTFKQVAEEGERPSPRGLVLIETRLSDHRMVDGLLVPFVLDISAGADERQRVAFETVEVNPPIGDARFAVPPGAKPPPRPAQ
jgi:hypothetical protein